MTKQPRAARAADDTAQQAQLEDIEREISEANAAVRAAAGWTRDDDRLTAKLLALGATHPNDPLTLPARVDAWNDHEAFTAETFADAMFAPGRHRNEDGDEVTAEGDPIDLPTVLADWEIHFEPSPESEPDLFGGPIDPTYWHEGEEIRVTRKEGESDAELKERAEAYIREVWPDVVYEAPITGDEVHLIRSADNDATFTAEEIAAGQTPVVQEDEAETPGAELAQQAGALIDPADPIVTVETPTAPVAVRLNELQRLVNNRLLYKTEGGFTPNYHPPYVDPAVAEIWVRAGLAEWEPTAGTSGGVRVTPEARSLVVCHRADAA